MGIPITAFMLLDLWANSKAAQGGVAFQHALRPLASAPRSAGMAALGLLLIDVASLIHARFRKNASLPSVAWFGAAPLALALLRVFGFWRHLWAPGHTLEDARGLLIASASSTWHGVPFVSYVWVLLLAATATFFVATWPAAVTRWLGREADGRRRAFVVSAVVIASLGFVHASSSVLTLATGTRALTSADDRLGTCAPAPTP